MESQLKTFRRWRFEPLSCFLETTQATLISHTGLTLDHSLWGSEASIQWERTLSITRYTQRRQREGLGIAIAVTPMTPELISSGITQSISIQFSVIRNQREEEREGEHKPKHLPMIGEEMQDQNCWLCMWVDLSHLPARIPSKKEDDCVPAVLESGVLSVADFDILLRLVPVWF